MDKDLVSTYLIKKSKNKLIEKVDVRPKNATTLSSRIIN